MEREAVPPGSWCKGSKRFPKAGLSFRSRQMNRCFSVLLPSPLTTGEKPDKRGAGFQAPVRVTKQGVSACPDAHYSGLMWLLVLMAAHLVGPWEGRLPWGRLC